VHQKRARLREELKQQEEERKAAHKAKCYEEQTLCHWLTIHCEFQAWLNAHRENIFGQIDWYLNDEKEAKRIPMGKPNIVYEIITKKIPVNKKFQVRQPSNFFLEFPEESESVEQMIIPPEVLLVRILEQFGLPVG